MKLTRHENDYDDGVGSGRNIEADATGEAANKAEDVTAALPPTKTDSWLMWYSKRDARHVPG